MFPTRPEVLSNTANIPLFDRELSWLVFNGRVLDEASDPCVPLYERMHFLAIFSSNLDEFFRIRVASLRSLLRLESDRIDTLPFNPVRLLYQIYNEVGRQQEQYGRILRTRILPDLEKEGVVLKDDRTVSDKGKEQFRNVFSEEIRPKLEIHEIVEGAEAPFLPNGSISLIVELWPRGDAATAEDRKPRHALVSVPSPPLARFYTLDTDDGQQEVVFIDDVIRMNLQRLFPERDVGMAYAIKLSRDANLNVEDEFSGDLMEMIRLGLAERERGIPSRLLYDGGTPFAILAEVRRWLRLEEDDMFLGGRYHNMSDLSNFPRLDRPQLSFERWPAMSHPALQGGEEVFRRIASRDQVVFPPYHNFGDITSLLAYAAEDPSVEAMASTVYRAAPDSAVVASLTRAAKNGKRVEAFVELKAQFDERSNLRWVERLRESGVTVSIRMPGLKVHAKLVLIERREDCRGSRIVEGEERGEVEEKGSREVVNGGTSQRIPSRSLSRTTIGELSGSGEAGGEEMVRRYAYLSTGNFNEKTAGFYTDIGILTAHEGITADVRTVFDRLMGRVENPVYRHLLVAPEGLRPSLNELIQFEIEKAQCGERSGIRVKLNNLEDELIIRQLYEASCAGVPILAIVRGICRLVPGIPGVSEHIRVFRLVDRFLEHSRIYEFFHGGEELLFVASADWMTRNLDLRVEYAAPVYDPDTRRHLQRMLDLQFSDRHKLDEILPDCTARRFTGESGGSAQAAMYEYVRAELA